MEEREKKAKANMRVMAKIAYKEWKEKKREEIMAEPRRIEVIQILQDALTVEDVYQKTRQSNVSRWEAW